MNAATTALSAAAAAVVADALARAPEMDDATAERIAARLRGTEEARR